MVEPLSADFSPVTPTEIRRGAVIDAKFTEVKTVDAAPPKAEPPKRSLWQRIFGGGEPAPAAGGQPPTPPKASTVIQAGPPPEVPKIAAPQGRALAVVPPAGPAAIVPPAGPAAPINLVGQPVPAKAAEGFLSRAGSFFKAIAANPIVNKVIAPVGAAIGTVMGAIEALDSKNGIAQRVLSGLESAAYATSLALTAAAPFTGGATLIPAALIAGGTLLTSEAIRTGAHLLGMTDPKGETGIKPGAVVSIAQGISNLVSGPAVPDAKAAPGQVREPGAPITPDEVRTAARGVQPYSSIAAIAQIKDGQTFARHQAAALNGTRGVGTAQQRADYQREAVATLGGEEAAKKVMETLYRGDAAKVKIAMDRLYDGKSHGPETRAIAQALKGEAIKAAVSDDNTGVIGPKTIDIAKKKAPAPPAQPTQRGPQ